MAEFSNYAICIYNLVIQNPAWDITPPPPLPGGEGEPEAFVLRVPSVRPSARRYAHKQLSF